MDTNNTNKETDDISYEVLPEDHNEYDLSFKLIIIGDSGKFSNTLLNLLKLLIKVLENHVLQLKQQKIYSKAVILQRLASNFSHLI